MDKILTCATVLTPIVAGVVEILKRFTPATGKVLPILGVISGVAIGALYGATINGGDIAVFMWAGAISGMSAVGVYELIKSE